MADNVTNDQHMIAEVHQPDPGHDDPSGMLVAIDPGMVIWTWLVFFLFLFILRKFAWNPILQSLEDREESVRKSVDDAAEAKRSLESASQEQQELIDGGRKKATEAINQARTEANAAAEEVRVNAREASEKMIADACEEIEKQQAEAIAELRSEAGNLSVLVASKLLGANLDDDRNRRLANDYITGLSG